MEASKFIYGFHVEDRWRCPVQERNSFVSRREKQGTNMAFKVEIGQF